MKRAERPLYPLRRTKDEDRAPADGALAFECRTAATFDRLRIGHLARRLALDVIAPGWFIRLYRGGPRDCERLRRGLAANYEWS
jgi:hypothetical protein